VGVIFGVRDLKKFVISERGTHTTTHLTHLIPTAHSSHTFATQRQAQEAFKWQAQYTKPSGGAAARVAAAGPRLAFVWQAQYTEPSGGAGAAHRAFWRSCCARGRRWAAAWLSCGRRSTQSLLEELLRAWPPLGRGWLRRGWLSCGRRWQAQYTKPSGQSAARVAAAAASRDRRRRENLCLMSALCVNVVRGLVARLVPS